MIEKIGLCSSDSLKGIPLEGTHVQAQVLDTVAQVSIVQFYNNTEEYPIEAKYIFPLDSNAAVCDFQAEINGKIIAATVKEKEAARAEYNRAIARGDGAYLLEEKTCEIFEIAVGNIPAHTRVNVLITYVVELKVEQDGSTRFFMPTTIAPRYTPCTTRYVEREIVTYTTWHHCWDKYPCGRPHICYDHFFGCHPRIYRPCVVPVTRRVVHVETIPGEPLEIPTRTDVPYALSCSIEIQSPSKIVEVTSKTHKIRFDSLGEDGLGGLVTFFQEKEPMNRDFVLNIKQEEPHQPRAIVEVLTEDDVKKAGKDASLPKAVAMVTLVPEIEFEDVRAEIIFVVDRSGSMSGARIRNVREAMQLFLRGLPSDCFFNIVGFGSNYELLFGNASTEYNNQSLKEATQHIDRLEANLGGTEILKPLQFILSQPSKTGYSRQIFLLTDGEVSNTDQVVQTVSNHCRKSNKKEFTRVFTIGIGSAVSHALVEGIARVGRGTAEFIIEGERMEPKVMKQLKNALQPALTEISIVWSSEAEEPKQDQAESGEQVKTSLFSSSSVSSSLMGKSKAPAKSSGFGSLIGHKSPSLAVKPSATRNESVYQSPFEVPPIFSGTRFTAFAFLNKSIPKEIVVTAQSPDGPLTLKFEVQKHEGNMLQKLAARALIKDLEEGTSHLHSDERAPSLEAVKREVVKLGTAFGLASKYTSFLAVEDRSKESVLFTSPVQVAVPVLVPQPMCLSRPHSKVDTKKGYSLFSSVGGLFGSSSSTLESKSKSKKSFDKASTLCKISPAPIYLASSQPQKASSIEDEEDEEDEEECGMQLSFFDGCESDSALPPPPSQTKSSARRSECAVPSSFDNLASSHSRKSALPPSRGAAPLPSAGAAPVFSSNLASPPPPPGGASAPLHIANISSPTSLRDEFNSFIRLQQSDGSFESSSELCQKVKVESNKLEASNKLLEGFQGDAAQKKKLVTLWATIVAIKFIEKKYATMKDEWELVIGKSIQWVKKNIKSLSTKETYDSLQKEAEKVIT
jgi:uncharacterized protein YegL